MPSPAVSKPTALPGASALTPLAWACWGLAHPVAAWSLGRWRWRGPGMPSLRGRGSPARCARWPAPPTALVSTAPLPARSRDGYPLRAARWPHQAAGGGPLPGADGCNARLPAHSARRCCLPATARCLPCPLQAATSTPRLAAANCRVRCRLRPRPAASPPASRGSRWSRATAPRVPSTIRAACSAVSGRERGPGAGARRGGSALAALPAEGCFLPSSSRRCQCPSSGRQSKPRSASRGFPCSASPPPSSCRGRAGGRERRRQRPAVCDAATGGGSGGCAARGHRSAADVHPAARQLRWVYYSVYLNLRLAGAALVSSARGPRRRCSGIQPGEATLCRTPPPAGFASCQPPSTRPWLAAVACFAAGKWPPKLRVVPGGIPWGDITVGRDHQCGLTIDGQGEQYGAVQDRVQQGRARQRCASLQAQAALGPPCSACACFRGMSPTSAETLQPTAEQGEAE